MQLQFKKCDLGDLHKLRELSEETFIDAFEKHNNPEDFKAYVDTAFSLNAIKSQLINPSTAFYFVIKDEEIIGYFKVNEQDAQSDLHLENTLELERVYVVKQAQGNGYGTIILNEIIDKAKSQKMKAIWLGVWEHNTDAIRFYERYGFKKFGSHPYWLGNDKQTDFVMRYDL
ncbi:GNAT family N-acetyltransferase [Spongiivirga citrea]|uniref:GNAT family N-acetyltransferase n=1 Tax=Spongiivirga citrea TaxID=1481457 RepID=A0A6M0CJC3_9FLAO|nr:GNAT family N-acetyltransferase [Spongiivirga citrea]NER17083.1 GNAT family N-acetyltransferase [Spongiivirga citrea]